MKIYDGRKGVSCGDGQKKKERKKKYLLKELARIYDLENIVKKLDEACEYKCGGAIHLEEEEDQAFMKMLRFCKRFIELSSWSFCSFL